LGSFRFSNQGNQGKESKMKLDRIARTILSVTAIAWSIPFALAAEPSRSSPATGQPGIVQPQANNAEFVKLDTNRDGTLSRDEVRHIRGYDKAFTEADKNGDGRLDSNESIMAHSLYERALAARVAADSLLTAKVKTALLREKNLDSLDVSVETFRNEVLLSGFVKDETQRAKALQVASAVSGVERVKDGLAVRK
jgi:hyperosmotically inducible periplasmic protein